jgi:hypothetical protein
VKGKAREKVRSSRKTCTLNISKEVSSSLCFASLLKILITTFYYVLHIHWRLKMEQIETDSALKRERVMKKKRRKKK